MGSFKIRLPAFDSELESFFFFLLMYSHKYPRSYYTFSGFSATLEHVEMSELIRLGTGNLDN